MLFIIWPILASNLLNHRNPSLDRCTYYFSINVVNYFSVRIKQYSNPSLNKTIERNIIT